MSVSKSWDDHPTIGLHPMIIVIVEILERACGVPVVGVRAVDC